MGEFGQRLRKLREDRRWSMQELARRSGVHYMTIYRLEKGISQEPLVSGGAALAHALGVSLDVLAGTYSQTLERNPRDHSAS
jgi:transcriptional regulator with XRE-family HTH domain